MIRNYFMVLLAVGVMVSMMPSRQPTSSAASAETSEPSSFTSRRSTSSEDAMPSDAIVLDREPNGHFFADVEINGAPVRVLVDTGATGIALSRSDAQRAGLAVSAGMFEVIGQGANGDVHGEFVKLDRVSLGSKTVEGIAAVVLDEGNHSLLGQNFLSKFETVEIRGDKMYLR